MVDEQLLSPKHQLVKNSIVMGSQVSVTTVIALVLPPLMLGYLGKDGYGIWAMMVLISGYTAVLDLGIGGSMVKYIAEGLSRGDTVEVNRYMGITLSLYLILVVITCASVLIWGDHISRILLTSIANQEEYKNIFIAYTLVSLSAVLFLPFSVCLKASQRYDMASLLEIIGAIANAAMITWGLVIGKGLWAVVLGSGVAGAIRLLGYPILAKRFFPALRIRLSLAGSRECFGKLLLLSPPEQIGKFYNFVIPTITRMSLERSLGVSFVGYYDIAKRIVAQLTGINSLLFVPLLPVVSGLDADGAFTKISNLIKRNYHYLMLCSVPLTVFIFVFYTPILRAWLGIDDVYTIAWLGRVILVFTFFEVLTGPITTAAIGMGNARIGSYKLLISFAVYLLVPAACAYWGAPGALAVESAAVFLGSIVSFHLYKRLYGSSHILSVLQPFVMPSLSVWLAIYIAWRFTSGWRLWLHLYSWAGILVLGCVGILLIYKMNRLWTNQDLQLIKDSVLGGRTGQ